jgi:hypothetical protein
MNKVIKQYIYGLEFGELQTFKNMGVIPLLTPLDGSPEYLTLKEALDKRAIKIEEVSERGSVPELKVINDADSGVLLLDGEELAGAKQNRVLNTSILIRSKSEAVIPVSCTEQGRWSYESRQFRDSDTVMSTKIRRVKAQSVSDSLAESREYRSDQGTVWSEIEQLSADTGARSETGAMRHVFEAKTEDLDAYLNAFTFVSGQKGLLVFLGEDVTGFDFLSRASAYEILHPKLVKSYALDALVAGGVEKDASVSPPDIEKAKSFLKAAQACKEKKYESVGEGWDFRFEGKPLVGSALKVGDCVIHMAFFAASESDKTGPIAGTSRRRRFRVG